jgi:uncharacterized membrane protein YoaK (UPF0700 family)
MDPAKRHRTELAVCLTGLAGFVDAMGLQTLGDLFVSFMSGDSTEFSARAARGALGQAAIPATLIVIFVLGSALGSLIGRLAGRRRPPAVLLLVAVLLADAATLHIFALDHAAALVMALAMGTQNGVFEGESGISAVTYITGTLVKAGQALTGLLFGESLEPCLQALSLWLGLVVGAMAGTWAWTIMGLHGLWIATAAALLLAGASAKLRPAPPH